MQTQNILPALFAALATLLLASIIGSFAGVMYVAFPASVAGLFLAGFAVVAVVFIGGMMTVQVAKGEF
jgi:hypothetical protein